MAWVEERRRSDGWTSYRVKWREGGARKGRVHSRTFASKAEAYRYLAAVEEAGQRTPVAPPPPRPPTDPLGGTALSVAGPGPTFREVADGYVDERISLTPGTRRRYRAMVDRLVAFDVGGYRPFDGPVSAITREDVVLWLRPANLSIKTRANYHGLLAAVFRHVVRHGGLSASPCEGTAPSRRALRAASPEMEALTETEFDLLRAHLAADVDDLVIVAVSTGLRLGELTALWVEDVDVRNRTLRVNKAWKEVGENGATDTPPHLARRLAPKHSMRGHYLGAPKSPRSRRTVSFGEEAAAALARCIAGKAGDDFVFTTPARSAGSSALRWAGGRAWHPTDFYENRWAPARAAARAAGVTKRLRFHDLRHTYAAWSLVAGADLLFIQRQLGHEDITTTMGDYGHLVPGANAPVAAAIDAALRGGRITRWRPSA